MKTLSLKAVREIKGLKSQTFTTALVALCGISVQIGYVSAYVSLSGAIDRFYTATRFADLFADVRRAPESAMSAIRAVPGVQVAESRVAYEANLRVTGVQEGASGKFISIGRHDVLNRIHVTEGRLPEIASPREACVSEGFARMNRMGPGASLETIINGKARQIQIVCIAQSPEFVYALHSGGFMPDDRHFGVFWMTREAMTDMAGFGGAFNSLAIGLSPGADPESVKKAVNSILDPFGNPGAYTRAKQASNVLVQNELYQLQTMGYSVPIIFLGVAAFLLHIVIGRLINRQREQIATLKAVGYSNFQVGTHYFSIVAVMTLAGAIPAILPGIWLGEWTVELYKDYFKIPDFRFVFDPLIPASGVLFAILASFAGALSNLLSVMKMKPAEAMRPPAPARFKKTLFETVTKLSPFSLMGFRHVVLRPVRSMMAVAGLSMAAAIIMLGMFWQDTVSFLLEFQFYSVQREDTLVMFQGPRPSNVLSEIRVIPGVYGAEGYRIAPVRIHRGHRSKELALTGMPPDARLRRVLGRDYHPLRIPENGLLLNRVIAERLEAKPGDILTVELLEGDRRTVDVPLSGTVEELLGSGAYMNLASLNRMLREGPVISMAALSVDSAQLDNVQRKLRSIPYVLSVDSKAFVVKMFHAMYADLLIVMAVMLVGFAAVIAVGVVYNTVMVALAERSWELASLRVLGFTRGEVFRMLLVELTLELIVAMPVGIVLGYWMMKALMAGVPEDQFHFPVIMQTSSIASTALILIASAAASAFLVWRRIKQLDLVAVLKVRE